MTKLLLTICLLMSTAAAYLESDMREDSDYPAPRIETTIYDATIGNLTIKMQDGNDEWIEVYKDGKLVLEEKCTMMCDIYIVKSESFDFRFEDGLVKADGRIAFKVHPDNIEVFKTGWVNQNEVIGFVRSSTGATGLAGFQHIYTIDIDSGDVSTLDKEFDNYLK